MDSSAEPLPLSRGVVGTTAAIGATINPDHEIRLRLLPGPLIRVECAVWHFLIFGRKISAASPGKSSSGRRSRKNVPDGTNFSPWWPSYRARTGSEVSLPSPASSIGSRTCGLVTRTITPTAWGRPTAGRPHAASLGTFERLSAHGSHHRHDLMVRDAQAHDRARQTGGGSRPTLASWQDDER